MSSASASAIARSQMTLEVYAHVLPDMQREAAETIGAILSGKVR